MEKKCDLCGGVGRMYCESDEASLCWNCDGKVHGANFLVAKHTRCLLCSSCHSPTPWKATGFRLCPTFSLCDSCVALQTSNSVFTEARSQDEEDLLTEDDGGDGAESYNDDEDEDEYDDDFIEEELENQVVPWTAAAVQPPPVTSSSSSSNGGGGGETVAKRIRVSSDDEIGCSSSQESNYSPPLKGPLRN